MVPPAILHHVQIILINKILPSVHTSKLTSPFYSECPSELVKWPGPPKGYSSESCMRYNLVLISWFQGSAFQRVTDPLLVIQDYLGIILTISAYQDTKCHSHIHCTVQRLSLWLYIINYLHALYTVVKTYSQVSMSSILHCTLNTCVRMSEYLARFKIARFSSSKWTVLCAQHRSNWSFRQFSSPIARTLTGIVSLVGV